MVEGIPIINRDIRHRNPDHGIQRNIRQQLAADWTLVSSSLPPLNSSFRTFRVRTMGHATYATPSRTALAPSRGSLRLCIDTLQK